MNALQSPAIVDLKGQCHQLKFAQRFRTWICYAFCMHILWRLFIPWNDRSSITWNSWLKGTVSLDGLRYFWVWIRHALCSVMAVKKSKHLREDWFIWDFCHKYVHIIFEFVAVSAKVLTGRCICDCYMYFWKPLKILQLSHQLKKSLKRHGKETEI